MTNMVRFLQHVRCPTVLAIGVLFLCLVPSMDSELIMGEDDGEFDFDGLPGAQHEFKVGIPGSYEDCFFQPVTEGAKFHVNFEVLKGGDKMVDFYVRNPQWQVIDAQKAKISGVFSLDNTPGGTYAVCIDNTSRFGGRLVYIYMVTFVMHTWMEFQKELMEVNVLAANFSSSLGSVQESVADMRNSQTKARFNVVKDWYLLMGNNYYVLVWSVAQCVLIVLAAFGQVYSVRRLFRTTNVTPTSKPRA